MFITPRLVGGLMMLAAGTVTAFAAHPGHPATKPGGATKPAVVAVQIRNFAFVPQVVTVAPGTTVTWTNVDEDPHTVTANTRAFHSAALDTGGKFSFTFATAGDYAYFCTLHPHMTGKIIVK